MGEVPPVTNCTPFSCFSFNNFSMAFASLRLHFYQLIGAIRISLVVGALASTTIAVGIIIAIITTILATFASFSSLFI